MRWREFTGTRELIEDGDQVRHKLRSKWFPVDPVFSNTKTHLWPNYRFRTKRRLTEQFDDAANLVVKESLITELKAEVERLRSQSPVWPEIVRLQGKIADLERQLLSARNDAFILANALSESERKLEVAQKQLKNYTNAIETL
jgi:hypothetical protein